MPKTRDDLFAHLAGLGITTETVSHPPLYTVAESQALRGSIEGAHTKNLFLKDRKDRYFLLTVEENAVVDLKTIHTVIGASGKVSFGKPEALMELLGVSPGAVTLFGVLNDKDNRVAMFLDQSLVEAGRLNAHPLVNTETTTISSADAIRFLESTGHKPELLKLT